ncbi:coagulation factor IX-like [Amblyomma americanum]|uniref:Peptidase S1 domain-containing protein n=1 Tax=Amblyomma americanum TaxID=6943 RepID=A0AAQ4E0N0_AMBAM
MLAVLLASLLGAAASPAELPWSRVGPGVSAEGCDPAPGSADRFYWLRDGRRLASPAPDRFWEPGAYVCVREGNRTVSLQRALLVAEEVGVCFAADRAAPSRRRRVADGVRARDAPWVAQLLVAGRFLCGSSLIGQRWALTAAHCLPEGNDTALALALGATRQNGPRVGVLRALPHPDYVRGSPSREHDVALLLLERPRRRRLSVACLPPAEGYLERFSQGVLFGWGRVGPRGGPALRLQEASLPIVTSRERCEAAVENVAPTAFCAGFGEAYRADACEGDSGGPLVGFVDERPVLLGIVSWGHACARPFTFGVYTRVDSYLDWIRGHVLRAV